ncbi:unnamed protein product [Closterium sp. NIES-53]
MRPRLTTLCGGKDDRGNGTKNKRRCTAPPTPVPPNAAPPAPTPPGRGSTAPAPRAPAPPAPVPPAPAPPAPASPAPVSPAPAPPAPGSPALAPPAPAPPTPLPPSPMPPAPAPPSPGSPAPAPPAPAPPTPPAPAYPVPLVRAPLGPAAPAPPAPVPPAAEPPAPTAPLRRVQTQDRKDLTESLVELETDCADPRDQDITDLTFATQGEDRGVTRVVVNNQQNVALAALSTDAGWAPHILVESLQGSSRQGKRGVRSGVLPPLDAKKPERGRQGREGRERPGKTRNKEAGVHATKAWQGGVTKAVVRQEVT